MNYICNRCKKVLQVTFGACGSVSPGRCSCGNEYDFSLEGFTCTNAVTPAPTPAMIKQVGNCPTCGAPIYGPTEVVAPTNGSGYLGHGIPTYSCSCRWYVHKDK